MNPPHPCPVPLDQFVDSLRAIARAHAEAHGVGSEWTGIALFIAGQIMLEMNFGLEGGADIANDLMGMWKTAKTRRDDGSLQ